jgi:two-component system, LuxR family, sensor kinase FixL
MPPGEFHRPPYPFSPRGDFWHSGLLLERHTLSASVQEATVLIGADVEYNRIYKQTRRPPLSIAHSGSAAPGSLQRTVRVSYRAVLLRTLMLGSLFSAILGALFFIYYRAESSHLRSLLAANEQRLIQVANQTILEEASAALSDLRYLSSQSVLRKHVADLDADAVQTLAAEYKVFLEQKRQYDQVRFLDVHGWERVRVNAGADHPEIVPLTGLQNKRDRYYFREALALGPNEIYVSPFDLNVEGERVELPAKPAIRFALPIYEEGERHPSGVLVLNYVGSHLLDKLKLLGEVAKYKLWLLDADGYWLLGPTRELEWGFMFPDRRQSNMAKIFPEAWKRIAAGQGGLIEAGSQVMSFVRVFPLPSQPGHAALAKPMAADRYSWILAAGMDESVLRAQAAAARTKLLNAYGVLAAILILLAWGLAIISVRSRTFARSMEKVLDHVPAMIAYVDKEQRYRFNNRIYEEMWGATPAELYGRRIRDVIGDAAYEAVRPHVEMALSGKQASFERRLDYRLAGPRDVRLTYVPDFGDRGEVRGFYALTHDVTLLKETQKRERQRMLEIAHISRLHSMGEIASEIAHEVNQPLSAIMSYSAACLRTLSTAGGAPETVVKWLNAISADAKRAGEVIQRLRKFAQRREARPEPVDLNAVINEVVTLLRGETLDRGIHVALHLRQDLPPALADRVLIEQVISSLARNAIDAVAEKQSGKRTIEIATRGVDGSVEVAVSDNGPGIPAELAERMFDSFVTTKRDGLGMGLTISRSIAEAHGGRLLGRNNPEGGATFSLTLPTTQP